MQIHVNLTRDDFIAFTHAAVKRVYDTSGTRRIAFVLNIVFWTMLGFFIVMIGNIYRLNEHADLAYLDEALAVLAIAFSYGYLYSWWLRRRYLRSAVTEGGNSIGEFSYTFLEDRVIEETTHSKTFYDWSALQAFSETDDYIFLYTDVAKGMFIPKRDLQPGQLDGLLAMLANKCISEY